MKIGTIYDITFSTNRADTAVLSNADSTPVVRVTENGALLAYLPTVTSLSTGIYIVTIDTSSGNGFEIGKRYTVYATATVNSIAGALGIDSFTIDTRSIDDVLPTASYTAPDNATISAIQTEVNSHPTLTEIEASTILAKEATIASKASQTSVNAIPTNPVLVTDPRLDNLDAPVSGAGGGSGGLTPEQAIQLSEIHTNVDRKLSEVGGGGVTVDMTKKHEDIIEKYEKLLLKKLQELIKELPKTDISPLALAISSIKPVDLTDVVTGLGAMNTQIKGFSTTMTSFYEKEKKDIETKYANEIDKKNSLLAENEYNLKQKQSEIEEMSKNVKALSEEIEKIKKDNEEELQEVEKAYLNKIEIVKIAKEEEIVEKIIPLLTP